MMHLLCRRVRLPRCARFQIPRIAAGLTPDESQYRRCENSLVWFAHELGVTQPYFGRAVSRTYIKQSLCYPYYLARAGGKMRTSKALPSRSHLNAVVTLR
jgi:hypothetical protein